MTKLAHVFDLNLKLIVSKLIFIFTSNNCKVYKYYSQVNRDETEIEYNNYESVGPKFQILG